MITKEEANRQWKEAVHQYGIKAERHLEELKKSGIKLGLDGEDSIMKGYRDELYQALHRIRKEAGAEGESE